jgi:hypothetical protein
MYALNSMLVITLDARSTLILMVSDGIPGSGLATPASGQSATGSSSE